MLRNLLLQLAEEIERVQWLQLVEVSATQFFEHLAIESGEQHLLIAVLVREVGRAWGKRLAEFVLALLVSLQDFACTLDHAARKPGEAGNFDAVTLVRAAGLHV